MKNYKRTMVTAALPYANGPVHIGHLAGVYIPADIYVRYLRLRKKDVKFVCGSDEHGVPITIKARNENVSPQDIVDKYHTIIDKAFKDFGITFDKYSRTSSKMHHETSSNFFRTLYDKGEFIEKESEQYYDEVANQFLADRYIMGTCPICSNENAYGDQCEKCGSTLSPLELKNPRSAISGSKPVLRNTKHWYLPLDKHQAFLEQWLGSKENEWKSNVVGQCKSWLNQGLQPRAVSRDLDWGVPVPVENSKGKVLYVWFDAPIGYISITKELANEQNFNWEDYWKNDDTRLIHFIGKDNIVFHCIVFPSMLKAHGDYILPENVPANEFLNLEGEKISTSRNWAVWLHEYLIDFPNKQDVLRYTLTANMPETKDNDFTWKDFQARNNSELVAILGNFINRALVLTQKYFNNCVPSIDNLQEVDLNLQTDIKNYRLNTEKELEHFRFREALKEAMNIARAGNKYLADMEPWKLIKTDEKRVATILNNSLQLCANLAIVLEPFMPFTSERIRTFLNIPTIDWEKAGEFNLLSAGHELGLSALLFEKIEDETIQLQLDKLSAKKPTTETMNITPQKEAINYEDFEKMDIRVGTIIEAERVPKTDKLMKLLIDTGIDKRTVVSGIAMHYTPEQCIDRQVCILANLQPRNLKGITSQGMILMAENSEGKLVFINPSEVFMNGATVR